MPQDQFQSYYEEYWQRQEERGHREDPVTERKIELVLQSIEPGDKVLDYGCGWGDFVVPLVNKGARVTGVDVSERPLEQARRRCPDAAYHLMKPGEPLPFADGEFDHLLAMEVIEHVLDTHGTFAEFRRVLKPGGRLAVSCPFHGLVKNLLIALLWFEEEHRPDGGHIRFYTPLSLQWVLHQHGFAIRRRKRLGYFWPIPRTMYFEADKGLVSGPKEGDRDNLGMPLILGPIRRRIYRSLIAVLRGVGMLPGPPP